MMISVDGGRLAEGSIDVEFAFPYAGWYGEIHSMQDVGRTVRVLAFDEHFVYYGQALLTQVVMPDLEADNPLAPPVCSFQGSGQLHRRTIDSLADLLFTGHSE